MTAKRRVTSRNGGAAFPLFAVRLPPTLVRKIRAYAFEHDTTVQALMAEIVSEYFATRRVRRKKTTA